MKGHTAVTQALCAVVALSTLAPLVAQDIRIREEPGITCAADDGALTKHGYAHCLQGRRFSVGFTTVFSPGSAAWHYGKRAGATDHWWHTDSTLAYWLFSSDNVEALVKVLDGRDEMVTGGWTSLSCRTC